MPTLSRRSLLAALPGAAGLALLGGTSPAAALATSAGAVETGGTRGTGGPDTGTVLAALTRASHPLRTTQPHGSLRDLRPLGAAIGGARVVGLGEVLHGAHELFTLKHRVFRYLVHEKGFATFALETSWTSGRRLNDYVLHGTGDPRTIMAEEFSGTFSRWPWGVHEYLELVEWMRGHNRRHPDAPVQFMGNDIAHPYIPGSLFDEVIGYAERHHPAVAPELVELYRELRAHATTEAFIALPVADRQRIAGDARRARDLLAAPSPGPDGPDGPAGAGGASGADGAAHEWTVQQARVIAQTATLLAFDLDDPQQLPEAMRYRDELMAHNTVWWHRHTGHKILLSAHNGHTAYETYDPVGYPVIQGTYMRQLLGSRYLSIGTTFGHGAHTITDGPNGEWVTYEHGPPREGSSDHTLDRVPHPLYLLDFRTVPPPADEWLHQARPTRDVGPPGDPYRPYTLAEGHDLLIHLHTLTPAHPLPDPPPPPV